MLSLSQKHDMEPKCVIGLSLQGSKNRHCQEFGLGAAQKRNVQTHCQFGHTFQLILIFQTVQAEI